MTQKQGSCDCFPASFFPFELLCQEGTPSGRVKKGFCFTPFTFHYLPVSCMAGVLLMGRPESPSVRDFLS